MSAAAKTRDKARNRQRQKRYEAKGGREHVYPTAERYNHGDVTINRDDRALQVPKEHRQRAMDGYYQRGQINERQWYAAQKLWSKWYLSGILSGTTGAYDGGAGSQKGRKHGAKPSKAGAGSKHGDAWRALEALSDAERNVVRAVVLFDQSATVAARTSGNPWRGLELLIGGLDTLAKHYGIQQNLV